MSYRKIWFKASYCCRVYCH